MIALEERDVQAVEVLEERLEGFRGELHYNMPLRDYTTIRIGGPADVIAYPVDEDDLVTLIHALQELLIPYHVIGNGSNLLVRDGGVRGVVINLSKGFDDISLVGDESVFAGAGALLARVVKKAKDSGLSGLEFAVGIPGSIGGAIVMNAGAYGGEISQVFEWMDIITDAGTRVRIGKDDVEFSYRRTRFEPGGIIVSALFRLKRDDIASIDNRMRGFVKRRAGTQRINLPNAGSIFKNPPNISAGALIDRLGLKGLKEGDAMVSDTHGNYIVNLGSARCRDVLRLIERIREEVYHRSGVELELEIKILGED